MNRPMWTFEKNYVTQNNNRVTIVSSTVHIFYNNVPSHVIYVKKSLRMVRTLCKTGNGTRFVYHEVVITLPYQNLTEQVSSCSSCLFSHAIQGNSVSLIIKA